MEIYEWLTTPAHVHRTVNNLYFVTVTIIALAVLVYAIKKRNKNAIYLFLFSIIVWGIIEGLVWGMGIRFYDSAQPQIVFSIVAFMEDPGWVCLAYLVAEGMYKKLGVKSNNNDETKSSDD